jgi:hypothetical protein
MDRQGDSKTFLLTGAAGLPIVVPVGCRSDQTSFGVGEVDAFLLAEEIVRKAGTDFKIYTTSKP